MEEPFEGQNVEPESEEPVSAGGFVNEVSGNEVQFGPGFAGMVSAKEDINMSRSGAFVVRAEKDISTSICAASAFVSGRDLRIQNGGGQTMIAGRDLDVTNGGGGVMVVGGSVTAKKSIIGIALSRKITVEEGSRVMLNTPQAIVFGATFGVAYAIVRWLLKGRRH